ncbi:MAG: exodeoxyribonuclease VII large subunit [Candidatus Saccharibacteria bacterium]
MDNNELVFSVSDFVAVLNQTLEYAYPTVTIVGELSNFRISKNKWVYFDLKDEYSSVKFFGTIYQLSGPLEDGLTMQVRGVPRLHPLYGFSVTAQSMQPVGEGSIKKAASLLQDKLTKEGLFDQSRKRAIPYPPRSVGLIASSESAAYHDFIKVLNERWCGVDISLADVQVQGEAAIGQIVAAIEHFNQQAIPPEVLIVTRGGGSADDLAVFSTEQVTRAVAGSRIPTIVAIGHEVDISLAELAADMRASTPSNAAQLLTPDKKATLNQLNISSDTLWSMVQNIFSGQADDLARKSLDLGNSIGSTLDRAEQLLRANNNLLEALSPKSVLKRGFAIIRSTGKVVDKAKGIAIGKELSLELADGYITVKTEAIELK